MCHTMKSWACSTLFKGEVEHITAKTLFDSGSSSSSNSSRKSCKVGCGIRVVAVRIIIKVIVVAEKAILLWLIKISA